MAFCAVAGWIIMVPADYSRLGSSIIATTLFSSNVFFWLKSGGYFDTSMNEKPLLHTWSLAVEEQFYVLFPLYLIALTRWLPKHRSAITTTLCVLSFLLCAVAVFVMPSATFYLAPTRAWELLLGCLLALGVAPAPRIAAVRDAASLGGLVLIAISVFAYTKETKFPGITALLPTLGTALIIWNGDTFVSRTLSQQPLVFIGQISYSLYLWHFVFLSFASYLKVAGFGERLASGEIAALLILATVTSIVSWKYVEQPARTSTSSLFSNSRLLPVSAALISLFCAFGVATWLSEWRLADTNAMSRVKNCFDEKFTAIKYPLCKVGKGEWPPQFVIWGDSHAGYLVPGFDEALNGRDISGILVGAYNCPALLGVNHSLQPSCRASNDKILQIVLTTPSIKTVILSARWAANAEGSTYEGPPYDILYIDGQAELHDWKNPAMIAAENHAVFAAGLETTIARLQEGGKSVWIVGPTPEVNYDVPRALHVQSLGFYRGVQLGPTFSSFERRQHYVISLFETLKEKYEIGIVWPHKVFCTGTRCQVEHAGVPLYVDDNHLSVLGAQMIALLLKPIFP
jgi:peptidoglycan/LPS O-acetylase OafA/YrhL